MALTTNLIAFWPCSEASGTRADSHTNGLTLTDNNTVTSNTGKVYALAAEFASANSESLSRLDTALLRGGDTDFTIAVWAYPTANTAFSDLVSKAAASSSEYELRRNVTDTSLTFGVLGMSAVITSATTSFSLNTWHLVIAKHDATNNFLNLKIDNVAVAPVSYSGGMGSGTGSFRLGIRDDGGVPYDGRIGPVALWRKVTSDAEDTQLWNSGAGLTYAGFTPTISKREENKKHRASIILSRQARRLFGKPRS